MVYLNTCKHGFLSGCNFVQIFKTVPMNGVFLKSYLEHDLTDLGALAFV